MTSSTSSSRGIYLRVLVAIALGMGASLGLVRLFTFVGGASAETILPEVTEARAALPRIVAEEKDVVLAFGSSMTDAAFGARQFDREMAAQGVEVKSFNFGFGGLNPYFQDYLARRVREAFDEADRRLSLAIVEFTPLQNTKTRYRRALPLVDSYVAMLASDAEIGELVLREPTVGIQTANVRYLRNGISAEMLTWFFGSEVLFPAEQPNSGLPRDEEAERTLEELGPELDRRFDEDYPDYVESAWSWEWQGAGTIPEERSPETLALFEQYYAALRNDRRMADDRLWRIHSADVENLDFEEELLAAFVRIVKTFQAFSDRVAIVVMPRNHAWIGRTPEGEARMRAALHRIREETGATVYDFEDTPRITPEMFADTTHLARYSGDVAYTSLLVEAFAPLFSR